MDNNKIEMLLSELLDEVRLITVNTKAEAFQMFSQEFLTSDLRVKMYNAFDGQKSLPEISKEIGCKVNTLQIFAQSLIDHNLVDYYVRGNARIISKSASKIAIFYANKRLAESEV